MKTRESFKDRFKREYALSDKGVKNIKSGAFWTVIVNLIVMGGMGILYFLMENYMAVLTQNAALKSAVFFIVLVVVFVLLSLLSHLQQYRATYGLVYGARVSGNCRFHFSPSAIWRT